MSKKKKINMGFILDSFDFTKPLKSIKNVATYLNIMNRPVGVVTKNYDHIRRTLYEKIGSHNYGFDGYGTPIGQLADVELNEQTPPWYYLDEKKNNTTNYIEYVNHHYFLVGEGLTPNLNDFFKDVKINTQVGVVRSYKIDGDEINTNPNIIDDTKLGEVNTIYLDQTLKNAELEYSKRSNNSITDNIYSNFSLRGKYGIESGFAHTVNGRVMTQNELLDDIIPWSTTDHNMYRSP